MKRARIEFRIGNGDANFARRRFSARSFSALRSLSIGSDKPFECVRDGKVLPYEVGYSKSKRERGGVNDKQ